MSSRRKTDGRRRARRLPGLLKDGVLGVCGVLGMAAIGWLIFSQMTGASIVVLKTGSMAPEMPQGSGALSFPVAAADLKPGDVVSVRLDDTSPIVTHRIVTIDRVPDQPAMRSLVLQGDANSNEDLFPYRVDTALKTSVVLPKAGPILATIRSPVILGGIVVLIGLLILWAFWPAPLDDIEAELAAKQDQR